ncbi:host nuclease inhibitor GamL, partial [Klebsiella pneumoniae]
MNAYRAYDAIEERKWAEQSLTEEKQKWIEDRAKEVFASLPEDPYAALRQSASFR